MERYKEKEFQKIFKGKISSLFTEIGGILNIKLDMQTRDPDEKPIEIRLSPEQQDRFNVKGRLHDGMVLVITTDMDGTIEKIDRILH